MRRWSICLALCLLTLSVSCRTPSGAPPPCPPMSTEAKDEIARECGPTFERCPGTRQFFERLVLHCRAVEALR